MATKIEYKVTLTLEFTDVNDAIKLLSGINRTTLLAYDHKKQINTAKIESKRVMKTEFVEPNIETINGVKCLVYPSKMNKV